MNTQELNQMNLTPMSELEMQSTDGGSIWGCLAILAGAILCTTGIGVGVGTVLIAGRAAEVAITGG